MGGPAYGNSGVALIAEADSVSAGRVAAELREREFDVERTDFSGLGACDAIAAVVLVDRESASAALRKALDRLLTPILVLADSRELVADVLPMLGVRHDLALVTDAADVIAWRLRRLIDLSRRLAYEQRHVDALTGLLTRRAFEEALRSAADSSPPSQVVGLLMIDLDRFKVINDRFGHMAGDTVLRAVGELLPRVLAPDDHVARLGGDEFGCLMIRYDTESIRNDSERLLAAIRVLDVAGLLARDSSPNVGASAGLTYVRPLATLEQLFSEADVAMYEAKNAGRERLVVYEASAEAASPSNADLRLRHFENSARLATERLAEMITLKSRRLIEVATREANVCSQTGLHNRRYFDVQLSSEIHRAHRQGRSLSLALIDLDHFHDINMTHGWPSGDRVLQAFASVARANVRATDWVARYGGEEFVVVMPDTMLDSAREVAERVRQAFASAKITGVDGQQVPATLSAGVVQLQDTENSSEAFVERASKALLRAKGAGRNRVEQTGAGQVIQGDDGSGWELIASIATDSAATLGPRSICSQRDRWHRMCNEWLDAHPSVGEGGGPAARRRLIESIAREPLVQSTAGAHVQRDDWQARCRDWLARFPMPARLSAATTQDGVAH